MSKTTVVPVRTKREQKQFLELPWRIYQGDSNWVPPLRRNQKELVGFARHPFYDQAASQAFLALQDGTPCGRILAIVNEAHIRCYNERRGFFGFFEAANDTEVAGGLFDAVKEWLAERDIPDIRGPVSPSMNYECGLLVEGFDSAPYFMMTYNPPYYSELIEGCGFQRTHDLYAFWGHSGMLETLDQKLVFIVEECKRRFQLNLRPMDRSRFGQEVRTFLELYNKSMVGTWGFTPLSEGEVDHLASTLKHLIVPAMTSVAEIDGRPVASAFALLDYNPRIKAIDGRLFPFGFIHLLWKRRKINRMRLLAANVLPEFQKWGLGLVVLNHMCQPVLDFGITEVEFSWVLETNHLSRKSLERGGAERTKTYRMYDFGPNAEPPPN